MTRISSAGELMVVSKDPFVTYYPRLPTLSSYRGGGDAEALPPLWSWDRATAAVHGLAPQNVKTRGDDDRGTDQQARGWHVLPHRKAQDHCPYQRKVVERHYCRGRCQ